MPPMWSSSSRTRLTNLQPHRAPLAASASCSPCLKTSEWHSTGTRFIGNFETLMEVDGKRVAAGRLESGERLATYSIVNAANCWGPELCGRLGMKVPVYPMRRLTFYFEIREKLEPMPLTRHISRNVSFRPQGAGYI